MNSIETIRICIGNNVGMRTKLLEVLLPTTPCSISYTLGSMSRYHDFQSPNQEFKVKYPQSRLPAQRKIPAKNQLDLIKCFKTLAALIVATMIVSCSNRTELDSSVSELTFKTLSGNDITLGDSNGPTLVNFWSTSCVICIKEMPHLAKFYKTHKADGFQIIAVAMPYDPPNEVVELTKQLRLPFPIALDIKGEANAAFGPIKGTPTSFLLDADGNFVKRYVGAVKLNKLEKEVAQLLKAS